MKVPWTAGPAKGSPVRLATAAAGVLAALLGPGAARADLPFCVSGDGRAHLNLTVNGVRSDDGLVTVTVYPDNPRRFLVHRGQIGVLRVPAHAPSTHVCVALPDAGVYAAVVYHYANGDRRFNRNAIGMPAEAYGFSNDPATFLGLPSFDSVRFKVQTGDNALTIRLHYPGG